MRALTNSVCRSADRTSESACQSAYRTSPSEPLPSQSQSPGSRPVAQPRPVRHPPRSAGRYFSAGPAGRERATFIPVRVAHANHRPSDALDRTTAPRVGIQRAPTRHYRQFSVASPAAVTDVIAIRANSVVVVKITDDAITLVVATGAAVSLVGRVHAGLVCCPKAVPPSKRYTRIRVSATHVDRVLFRLSPLCFHLRRSRHRESEQRSEARGHARACQRGAAGV